MTTHDRLADMPLFAACAPGLEPLLAAPHLRHTKAYWGGPGGEGLEISMPRDARPDYLAAITRWIGA